MKYQTKQEVFDAFKMGADKVLDHFKGELAVVRAGRANPKILDRVMVSYYGNMTPLNQMANITVPEPRMLMINVWDMSALKDVIKALNEANLGVNVSDDGKNVRLVFPQLTEERRVELVKSIKKTAEENRISLRNERHDAMDELKDQKKNNLLTEDEQAGAEKEIQKMLDEYNSKIDELLASKEKEIMEV
ncbi:MAG: ribosome recycling factor [Clostridiales bacterium]|nr:ribosome recycling factor [Candidatus Apopatousia equi]